MPDEQYAAVPLEENDDYPPPDSRTSSADSHIKTALFLLIFSITVFTVGFSVGQNWSSSDIAITLSKPDQDKIMPANLFIPAFLNKEVKFKFPTEYEDKGIKGDKLWNELMPIGSGFVRVPWPRKLDMPVSKKIEGDKEEAELYSLSVTHQLHCLGVLRDVIIKYEKKSISRFAGGGHEHHCLDYIRQAILCAGDTTLDFADDILRTADGAIGRAGFTGANSTHQCRDWDAIRVFAVETRSGDKTGIF